MARRAVDAVRVRKIREYERMPISALKTRLAQTKLHREEMELIAEALGGRSDAGAEALRKGLNRLLGRIGSCVEDVPDPIPRTR